MAAIALETGVTELGIVNTDQIILRTVQLGATLAAGAGVKASGEKMIAHTGTTLKPDAVLLKGGNDGDWVPAVVWGFVSGYDVSGVNEGALVKMNAGALDTATGANVGRVWHSQAHDLGKVVLIDCSI